MHSFRPNDRVGTALVDPVLRTANAGTITLSSPDYRPIVPR